MKRFVSKSFVSAVICLGACVLAQGTFAADCSCWGGGFIMGQTSQCNGNPLSFAEDPCPPGTLWLCKYAGSTCNPPYIELCCPMGQNMYYGCAFEWLSYRCCLGAPSWGYDYELGVWQVVCD